MHHHDTPDNSAGIDDQGVHEELPVKKIFSGMRQTHEKI
jgi:hypothetical protein